MQTNLESGNLNRQALVLPFTGGLFDKPRARQSRAGVQANNSLWIMQADLRRGQGIESIVWVALGLSATMVLILSLST